MLSPALSKPICFRTCDVALVTLTLLYAADAWRSMCLVAAETESYRSSRPTVSLASLQASFGAGCSERRVRETSGNRRY